MSERKHLPLTLRAPARAETADGWSINLPWTRHGDEDPYADAEAFAPFLVTAINAYGDMLVALKAAKELADVMEGLSSGRSDDEWIWAAQAQINAAIAKAEGRS